MNPAGRRVRLERSNPIYGRRSAGIKVQNDGLRLGRGDAIRAASPVVRDHRNANNFRRLPNFCQEEEVFYPYNDGRCHVIAFLLTVDWRRLRFARPIVLAAAKSSSPLSQYTSGTATWRGWPIDILSDFAKFARVEQHRKISQVRDGQKNLFEETNFLPRATIYALLKSPFREKLYLHNSQTFLYIVRKGEAVTPRVWKTS
jgi:hypothetical protein